jgi:hypothetical protein
VSQSNSSSTHLLTTFKGSTTSNISVSNNKSASSSQAASSSQSSSTIQSADHSKMLRPERLRASARGAPCTFTPSFLQYISSHYF